MKVIKKVMPVFMAVVIAVSLAACGSDGNSGNSGESNSQSSNSQSSSDNSKKAEAFPKFKGKDFDGNDVDESLFSKNEVSVLNFWFNGCSACVNEMPALEKFNEKLREKGAEIIGVNVQAKESPEDLAEAKDILAKQGCTYRNIMITEGQGAMEYLSKIFSFPTTILVDKNGNIIGDSILGSIESEKRMNEILGLIDDVKSGKDVSSSSVSSGNPDEDKFTKLMAEENNLFIEHSAVWDKVFGKVQKDNIQPQNDDYAGFLKSQVESMKDSFTEDEMKTLNEDLKRIEEIEKEIKDLKK